MRRSLQSILDDLYKNLDELHAELDEFGSSLFEELGFKPLYEASASDKIKMAKVVIRIQSKATNANNN